MAVKGNKCELCGRKAVLRCDADAASLCGHCDAKVHGANFLVARHVRTVICSACDRPTNESVSGPSSLCPRRLCCLCAGSGRLPWDGLRESYLDGRSPRHVSTAESAVPGPVSGKCCSPAEYAETVREERAEIQSQLSAVSVEETSAAARNPVEKMEMKMEAILRRWQRCLNLRSSYTVPLAMHLLEKALPKIGGGWINVEMRQKLRICLAASLWMASKLSERRSVTLKNIEECSGVPSKLIVRGALNVWNEDGTMEEEGWAECCP